MSEHSFNRKETNPNGTDFVDAKTLEVQSLDITACQGEPKTELHKFAQSAIIGGVLFAGSLMFPLPGKAVHAASVLPSIYNCRVDSRKVSLSRSIKPIVSAEVTVFSSKVQTPRAQSARPLDRSFRSTIHSSKKKNILVFTKGNKSSGKNKRILRLKCSRNENDPPSENNLSSRSDLDAVGSDKYIIPEVFLDSGSYDTHPQKAENLVNKLFKGVALNGGFNIGVANFQFNKESSMSEKSIEAQIQNQKAETVLQNTQSIREGFHEVRDRAEHQTNQQKHGAEMRHKEAAHVDAQDMNKLLRENVKKQGIKLDAEINSINAADTRAQEAHVDAQDMNKLLRAKINAEINSINAAETRAQAAETRAHEAHEAAETRAHEAHEAAETRAQEAHVDAQDMNKLLREKVQAEIDNLKK